MLLDRKGRERDLGLIGSKSRSLDLVPASKFGLPILTIGIIYSQSRKQN